MIFEKVNFNEEAIRKMTYPQFEEAHIKVLWLDRDVETRKKMLSEVYGLIKPLRRSRKKV